ncbi:MAG: DUF971 domain-containing protein [Cardiobacteriaceae bacterium]|nr:DUF971 domain-containing protein [Cardiobacteriaceae bacterium]
MFDDIPEVLRLSADKKTLTLEWANAPFQGEVRLDAEYLRVCSPSAEVRGHGQERWTTVSGKQGIAIYRIAPVGNYAVQIIFSDGHASGLYTWATLYDLALNREAYWARYLKALEEEGKSREPHQRRASLHLPKHLHTSQSSSSHANAESALPSSISQPKETP